MQRKHFLLIALFSLLSISLSAQTTWTLERCIEYALTHNLGLRQQRLVGDRAGHDLTQSYANLAPSLNANASGNISYGRSIDQVTNEFFTEDIKSQRMSASSGLTLFAGFRTVNNIRYNLARTTAFKHDTQAMENELVLTIANLYLQIMYLEDMVRVTGEQLDISREQIRRTQIMLEGGASSRGDLLDIEAVAAEEEVRYTNANNQLQQAYLELIILLELDPADEFSIVQPQVSVENYGIMDNPVHILSRALSIEPSVAAARSRMEMAEKGLAITRGQRSPVLSFNASIYTAYSEGFKRLAAENNPKLAPLFFNTRYSAMGGNGLETIPYRDQIKENLAGGIQLSLSIPLFNNLQTHTAIQQARIDLDQARLSLEGQKNQLGRIIHQAHSDAVGAYQQYISNSKALEASKEAFRYAESRFNSGLLSILEYNESKARLMRAEVSALQSMYEFVFMAKILGFYQGEGFDI